MFIIMEANNLLAKLEESLDTVVLMSMVAREMKMSFLCYVYKNYHVKLHTGLYASAFLDNYRLPSLFSVTILDNILLRYNKTDKRLVIEKSLVLGAFL